MIARAFLIGCLPAFTATAATAQAPQSPAWTQVAHLRQVPVNFTNGPDTLAGTLVLPHGRGPFPLVVYSAGSGRSSRDGYRSLPPIWRAFAARGIASFAWDKPGVGESTGNWRSQKPEGRVDELKAAVAAMAARPEVDRAKIGVWGISQAGWVMPPAITSGAPIAFMISVSGPEGTGHDQELYRVKQSLTADGFSEAEVADALAFSEARNAILLASAPFDQLKKLQDERAVGKRWEKEVGIFDEATYTRLRGPQETPVPHLEKIKIPVLAIYGERDMIVDWRESARIYRASLKKAGNKDVTIVSFPGADHVLFPSITGGQAELDDWLGHHFKVFAPGYVDTMADWIEARFVTPKK